MKSILETDEEQSVTRKILRRSPPGAQNSKNYRGAPTMTLSEQNFLYVDYD